jgi:DNA-directed RNA polymerase specialized sigma24 family protein
MSVRDPLSVVEAAYGVESGGEWLQRVAASAAAAFDGVGGAMAILYDSRNDDGVDFVGIACHEMSMEIPRALFPRAPRSAEVQARITHAFRAVHFGTFLGQMVACRPEYAVEVPRLGFDDMAFVNAIDPTGLGCVIYLPDRARSYPPRLLQTWRRLGAHIASGNRLRRLLATLSGATNDLPATVEAVLNPEGRIEHAVGRARTRPARELLQDALVRIDRARTGRADGERAVGLWRGLVDGRWSVVEHFERDGRRYFLAHRNQPELQRDRALTEREQQVLAYATLGHSNKLIAYSLGLSLSTVGAHLAQARKKLGKGALPLAPRQNSKPSDR